MTGGPFFWSKDMDVKPLLAVLLLSLLVSGCVVTEQDLAIQRKVMELQRRVDDSDRTLQTLTDDQAGSVRQRLETMARNQADFQAGLDGLRVDVQSLLGNNDDLARGRDEVRQEMLLLRDDLMLQIADLDQRLIRLEGGVSPAPTSAGSGQPESVVTPVSATPGAPAPAVAPTPAAETPAGLYERALKILREEQDFAQGRELMSSFLKRYPEDPLAINAAYWIGEAFYAEKNYEKAILQFEDVIQKYGDHPKVAAALLKQGLAFDTLGDRASGRLLLQRTVERFPASQEAKKAAEILKEWGS